MFIKFPSTLLQRAQNVPLSRMTLTAIAHLIKWKLDAFLHVGLPRWKETLSQNQNLARRVVLFGGAFVNAYFKMLGRNVKFIIIT